MQQRTGPRNRLTQIHSLDFQQRHHSNSSKKVSFFNEENVYFYWWRNQNFDFFYVQEPR